MGTILRPLSPAENFGKWWWRRTLVAASSLAWYLHFHLFPPQWFAGTVAVLELIGFTLVHGYRYRMDGLRPSAPTWIVSLGAGPLHGGLWLLSVSAAPHLTGTVLETLFGPFRNSFSAYSVDFVKTAAAAVIVCAPAVVIGTAPLWLLRELSASDAVDLARSRSAEANRILRSLSSSPQTVPAYTLYLRPFTLTDKLPGQPLSHQEFEDAPGPEHLDLETLLHRTFRPHLDFIAAGRDSEYLGAGRITLDEKWRDDIERLSVAATLIVLVPSANDGTLWEMRMLRRRNLLDRTVFVMPETLASPSTVVVERRLLGESFDGADGYRLEAHHVDLARAWQEARAAASLMGMELPPYDPRGMLFTLGPDGHPVSSAPLCLMSTARRVRRLRQTFDRLSPGAVATRGEVAER